MRGEKENRGKGDKRGKSHYCNGVMYWSNSILMNRILFFETDRIFYALSKIVCTFFTLGLRYSAWNIQERVPAIVS